MMRMIKIVIIILLLVAAAPDQPIEVLTTGRFHGEEIKIDDVENWLGLFHDGDKSFLKPVKLNIEFVRDNMFDAPGEKTGKAISLSDSTMPVMIIRGLSALAPGEIKNAAFDSESLSAGKTIQFLLEETFYEIQTKGDVERTIVTLHHQNQSQVLFDHFLDEGYLSILWAGDLDQDGKLDLWMNFSYKYSVDRRVLFLSSQAKETEISGKAAILHTTPGC